MRRLLIVMVIVLGMVGVVHAQDDAPAELAATLEVLQAGVEVQVRDTVNWVPVRVEAVVAFGDRIRTDATGRARITFFAEGVETELQPNTEYEIGSIQGTPEAFTIEVSVLAGQTIQRLTQLLDANSRYVVQTPGMQLAARGTEFAIRVEANGRSAMLVSAGAVTATNPDAEASVDPGFGIRAAVADSLSDVVRATTFDELDAALDGCTLSTTTPDDTVFNVRSGPSVEFPIIGTIAPADVAIVIGQTETSNWYRIEFEAGFGWFLSSEGEIVGTCAGLRQFPDTFDPAAGSTS
jgi:hypothetical protein